METLGERPVWSMSGSEMLSSLDAAYAEIARLKTFTLNVIAGLESTGYAKELGAGDTARLLTFRYRIDATEARRDVRLANALAKYPAVAAALPGHGPEDGAEDDGVGDDGVGERPAGAGVLLHPGQAEAIISALNKVPDTVPAEDLLVAEAEMVELGRTHGPAQLRDAGKAILNRLDTDGPEPDEQKAYTRESLTLINADKGVKFRGYLANENAELFRTLILAHAKPRKTIDGARDSRGRDKRQADALTTLLTTAGNTTDITGRHANTPATGTTTADHGTATTGAATAGTAADATGDVDGEVSRLLPGHGPKAHLTVTIDFNDLKNASANATGQLIYGDALSAATIRRLACDAQILPVVLGSNSQPLDVGTTVRLATGPMRKALIARDKGCVCCGAPPIFCEAHHVTSWIDGGATKITNLALLCKRCHIDLHDGHWDIQIIDSVVQVTRPTWADPGPVPRGRYRPPGTSEPGQATTGGSVRAWPRDTDPTWLTTTDDAAAVRLDPWGDGDDPPATTGHRSTPSADSKAGFEPWDDLVLGPYGGSSAATAPAA